MLEIAHKRHIRIEGRFDFSNTHKDAYDAHPEWFFKMANGQPAIYNGLYQACVNGGWYREKAPEILREALERYDVDGLFFNMFSNPAADYSGHPLGICHCDNCKRLYRERYHRDLPEKPDADYRAFLHDATVSMSEMTPADHQRKAAASGFGWHVSRNRRHRIFRIEHGRRSALATLAVRVERQRQSCAQYLPEQDGDQSMHVFRRLCLAFRHGAGTGSTHAALAGCSKRRWRGHQCSRNS